MGESLQQERESPWALTLTDPVPEAEQPGDSHVFLHEVVFLIDRRSITCSRRSDSGARAKNKASERAGGQTSLAFFFARAPLSECLEQATVVV